MKPMLAIIATAFLLVACNNGMRNYDPFARDPGALASGQYSRIQSEYYQYIEDAETYAAFWQRHGDGDTKPPPVDFSRHAVVTLFAGQRNSGGYSIETREVQLRGDTLQVEVIIFAPGAGCMVTMALTQPWQLVIAPRGATAVNFAVDSRRMPCQ